MRFAYHVTNDVVHTGTFSLPDGCESDVESHGGDEVFYVLEGVVSVIGLGGQRPPASKREAGCTGTRGSGQLWNPLQLGRKRLKIQPTLFEKSQLLTG